MTRIRTLRPVGFATVLFSIVLGLASAAVASDAIWIDDRFDPFDDDSANVEILKDGDVLAFVLQAAASSLPAEMSSDILPLDDDLDDALLEPEHAITLYGGLNADAGAGWVAVQLEGDGAAIHDAILQRLSDLGVSAEEDAMIGGPIRSYQLSDGNASWRIAISPNGDGALVHLQHVH